jgi:hypothetical protein
MADRPLARRMWQALEAYHGFIYFAPEADTEYTGVGLDAGMMGYFASRSAPMGAVAADVVIATFFNFEPSGVTAVLPEAWQRADPPTISAARLRAVDAGLRRMLGDRLSEPDIAHTAELARRAADACAPEGRPLYAGHRALAWPDEPHLALWHAITLLREYRGDGHVAALTAQGLSGLEALVVHGATGAVPATVLQRTRGWSDEAWASAVEGLVARGILAVDGSLTDDGAAQRAWVEERTDALAAAPWEALGDEGCSELMATGKALSRVLMAADAFSRPLR